ncbi:MAG TPA: DUF2795 domain-containing protein [Actinomycetota bacterium]|nr:DUF2795 domain-containing protein [Actinomycetota bacterium]
MAKVREQQRRDALIDVDYPADKQTLLDHAMRNGANGDVLAILRAGPTGGLRQLRHGAPLSRH